MSIHLLLKILILLHFFSIILTYINYLWHLCCCIVIKILNQLSQYEKAKHKRKKKGNNFDENRIICLLIQ